MKKLLALAILMMLAMNAAAFADIIEPEAPFVEAPDPPVELPASQAPAEESEPEAGLDPGTQPDPDPPGADPDTTRDTAADYEAPQDPEDGHHGETGAEGNLLPEFPSPDLTPLERREENALRRDELNDRLNEFAAPPPDEPPVPTGEGIDETLIDQLEPAQNLTRSLRIKSSVKPGSAVEVGQEVVLTAVPMGFLNVGYNLQWQWARIDENGNIGAFHNIEGANGLTYTIRFDADNIHNAWRAVIQEAA